MKTPRYQWQPTTHDIARRFGLDPSDVIRFDHNTSPFPTDWAPAVIAEPARHLNEYPEASYRSIREAAAKYAGVEPDNVVPGAGVDELILLLAKALLDDGSIAAMVTPTYPLYRIASIQRNARLVEVPVLPPDFEFMPSPLLRAVRDADVAWLCVPNNPTGNRIDHEVLEEVITITKGITVIDAAYAEIAGDEWAGWTERFEHLVVLHTLSKGFGLAGARVGFAVAASQIVDAVDSIRPPGSISSLSVDLAIAALDEPNRMRRRVGRLVRERQRFTGELAKLGLEVLPSHANFLLCRVGSTAKELGDSLMEVGLVVRQFPTDSPLAEYLRFTVRSPEEDDRLVEALWRRLP